MDARFLAPRQFAATLTRGQLVTTLITEVYPAAVIVWDDTAVRDGLVGRAVIAEDDRAGTLTHERNREHYLQAATLLGMAGITVHQMVQYALKQVVIELWAFDGRRNKLEHVASAYAAVHNAVQIGPITKMIVEAVRNEYRR